MSTVTVYLHGSLGERFGSRFRFIARDPRDVLRALSSQLDGFADALRDGRYEVTAGDDPIDETELAVAFGHRLEMHIVPAVAGAKSGAGKVVLGAALIAGTIMSGGLGAAGMAGAFANAGFSAGLAMSLSGVSSMLFKAPVPSYENRSTDTKTSHLFDGPINNSGQGLPIPLVYGRILAGSTVVSAGMTAEAMT